MAGSNALQILEVRRADHFLQARLAKPILGLFRDLPELLEHLLSRLGPYGLRLADVKFEGTADSLDRVYLNLALPGQGVIRVYLDRIEFDPALFIEPVHDLISGVVAALSAHSPDAAFDSYLVRYAFHGNLAEESATQFLSRFVASAPSVFGSPIGSGAIFYYGPGPETFAASVMIDLSRLFGEGLLVQVNAIYNASVVSLDDLRPLSSQKLREVLGEVGLRLGGER
jgi:hypothetical protein